MVELNIRNVSATGERPGPASLDEANHGNGGAKGPLAGYGFV
jgi:hypothetical protein